jgi:hypothetical protein
MRIVLLVLLLAGVATAEPPKPAPPDLVLTWTEGEVSRDSSIWRTTITVTGTKLHYSSSYSGRYGGMPNAKPVDTDATVNDPKRVAAALAALDKIRAKPDKQRVHSSVVMMRQGCVTRGKAQRCARAEGREPDPADLKAIAAIRDALLDGVKLPAGL